MLSSANDDFSLEILVQKVDDVICAIDQRHLLLKPPPPGRKDRQTDRQTDRQRDGQRHTDGRTDGQRQTDGQTDRWTETDR